MSSSTLALARRLGALRSRPIRDKGNNRKSSSTSSSQPFSFLLVLDFESTCWPKPSSKHAVNPPAEIIEFPVVLLSTDDGKVLDRFQTYVQPVEHPKLSSFCTELTGIEQAQVEAGVPLQTALVLFQRWLSKAMDTHGFVVNDVRPGRKSATFVTWSDWDLAVCLSYECRRKQISKPDCFAAWCDLRHVYSKFYSRRPQGLNGALQDVGISFEGREHSGLCDAENTAKLAWRMVQDGCVVPVTKFLNPRLVHDRFKRMSVNQFLIVPGKSSPKTPLPSSSTYQKKTPSETKPDFLRPASVAPRLKRTPPMCGCGRRSRFCVVQSPGPNQGRGFYACPRGRGLPNNCKYFKWENDLGQSPQLRQRSMNTFVTESASVLAESPSPAKTVQKMPSLDTPPRSENSICGPQGSDMKGGQQYFGNVNINQNESIATPSRRKSWNNTLGQSFISYR